ncbi:MAG: hypothetical protein GY711_11530 [bacterium]|nr:hypothetical protein [bacterium]
MKRKKTFREKLADDKDFPRVQPLAGGMAKRFGEGTIVLPSAREVDALMRRAKKGKLITINQIRDHLAARHDADMACPIVTGIHARIAAGAAGEDEADGKKRITPYWRTLKSGGELNEKYPGGLEGQAHRLVGEGHDVVQRGKKLVIEDYERALVQLD